MKTQTLVDRYAQDIKGVIECFDRVVFFGTYKAIGWTGAMEQHLRGRGTTFLEFNKSYANELRLEVADHVRTLARDLSSKTCPLFGSEVLRAVNAPR